ncbi:MAG: hypothetical protein JNM40_04260 [Myxococcales bacterium]|nr:hypothetical protein [Myxococcales bacterium]
MKNPAAPPPHGTDTAADREGVWQQIGTHRVRKVDDCVEMILNGPLLLPEMLAIEKLQFAANDQYGYWLSLVDCHNMDGIGPDTRRYIAERSRLHPHHVTLSALYGCSPMVLALTTLISRATALISGKPQPIEIFRDEASARACLATFRKARAGVPSAKPPSR